MVSIFDHNRRLGVVYVDGVLMGEKPLGPLGTTEYPICITSNTLGSTLHLNANDEYAHATDPQLLSSFD